MVHLSRDGIDETGNLCFSAREILEFILDEKTLNAYNYYCIFQDRLNQLDDNLKDKFKVVCFTETPIDQIEVLLKRVQGRDTILKPYGLVFKKEYIRQKGGNPVFYVTGVLSNSLWRVFNEASKSRFLGEENKLLALVNKCDESIDFHWEREWRIVGKLKFGLSDIYCGLCPEEDMAYFESKYQVKFISPRWGINKILDKLVGK